MRSECFRSICLSKFLAFPAIALPKEIQRLAQIQQTATLRIAHVLKDGGKIN